MLFLLLLVFALCGGGYYAYLAMKYGVSDAGEVVSDQPDYCRPSTFEERNGCAQSAKETMPGYYPETGRVIVG